MNRSAFIKNLIGLYGIGSLPLEMVSHYQKVYLLQCFVRGFQYYYGPKMIGEINKTGLLEMVREPKNKFDKNAIALHFNNQKIGFVPTESNEVLSVLMDAELLELQVEIAHIEPKAATWENIYIAVYALKEMNEPPIYLDKPYYLLETPHYLTLKNKNDTYTKIRSDGVASFSQGKVFHEPMVGHSANDGVYDLIHSGFESGADLEDALENPRFIVQKENIPNESDIKDIFKQLDSGIVEMENTFGKNNYVEANIDELAKIPDHIEKLVGKVDKTGNKFIEVVLKNV